MHSVIWKIIISQPTFKMKIFCISSQCSTVKNHQITGLLCSLMFTSLWLSGWRKKNISITIISIYYLLVYFSSTSGFPLYAIVLLQSLAFKHQRRGLSRIISVKELLQKFWKNSYKFFNPLQKIIQYSSCTAFSLETAVYINPNLKECNFSSFMLRIHSIQAGNWTLFSLPKTELSKFITSYCRETYRPKMLFYSHAIHIAVSQNFLHSWQCYYSYKNDIMFLILLLSHPVQVLRKYHLSSSNIYF